MSSMAVGAKRGRLPPEVNRILHVRNLPRKVTAEELYDVFGKYGPIRQIRVGTAPDGDAGKGGAAKGADLRGTAFVVYEDIYDAKQACDHLAGFNVGGRYLTVLYYQVGFYFYFRPARALAGMARVRSSPSSPPSPINFKTPRLTLRR